MTLQSGSTSQNAADNSIDLIDEGVGAHRARKIRGRGRPRGRARGRGRSRGRLSTEPSGQGASDSGGMHDDDAAPLLIAAAAAAAAAAVAEPPTNDSSMTHSAAKLPEKQLMAGKPLPSRPNANEQPVKESKANSSMLNGQRNVKAIAHEPNANNSSANEPTTNKLTANKQSSNETTPKAMEMETEPAKMTEGSNALTERVNGESKTTSKGEREVSENVLERNVENVVMEASGSGDEKMEDTNLAPRRGWRPRGRPRTRVRGRARGRSRGRWSRSIEVISTVRSRKRRRSSEPDDGDVEEGNDIRGDDKKLAESDSIEKNTSMPIEEQGEEDEDEVERVKSDEDNEKSAEEQEISDDDDDDEEAEEDERDDDGDDDYKQPIDSGDENEQPEVIGRRRSRRASALAGSAKITEVSNINRRRNRTRRQSLMNGLKYAEGDETGKKIKVSTTHTSQIPDSVEGTEEAGDAKEFEGGNSDNDREQEERASGDGSNQDKRGDIERVDVDMAGVNGVEIHGAKDVNVNKDNAEQMKLEKVRLELERQKVDLEIRRMELEQKRLEIENEERKLRHELYEKQRLMDLERLELERKRCEKEEEDRRVAQEERQALNAMLTTLLSRLSNN